jgi:hypothetical protein
VLEEEIAALQGTIDKLQIICKKAASVAPKSYDLWFEVIPQISCLGRFFHFMEDPTEKARQAYWGGLLSHPKWWIPQGMQTKTCSLTAS